MKVSIMFLHNFYHCFRHASGLFALLLALLLIGAFGFSKAEGIDFGSSVYFAFITGFTVGYGDIVPVTGTGRVIAVLISLIGILFIALLTAISVRALMHTMHPEEFRETSKDAEDSCL